MLLSLKDCQAAFAQAAQARTVTITVDGEHRVITTPFPSPGDWRDVWIYFIMLDRFNRDDGQPPRNMPYDAPFGEFQGGTFNGVRAQLKYIKELGAGAIWLTPVLKNRQTDPGSYHGYGIQDFLQPDPRFASEPGREDEELRALVDEAHALGLYVIFDIVLNHTGDVFGYKDFGSKAPYREEGYNNNIEWRDETGQARPDFPIIDTVPAAQRQPDGFIWPKELQHNNYFRRKGMGGEQGGDFESLKELVTELRDDEHVRPVCNALITAYQYAIARYDADGFRIDTLKYIDRDFARIFGNAMREYALSIGKRNFFTFGEVYDNEEKINEFLGRNAGDTDGIVGVDAALDFPLFYRLPSVAKGFAPPSEVIGVFQHRKEVQRFTISSHGDASRYFVTFLDNHDMRQRIRWADSDTPDAFDQQIVLAVALLFGLQGIPCLYYGTEQGLCGHGGIDWCVREALWGKPGGGFDRNHRFYKAIQELSRIRDEQPALRYGRLYFRQLSGDGVRFGVSPFAPGVLAFSRILNDQEVLVLANTSTQDEFNGYVLVDWHLHKNGDQLRVLNNPAAPAPGPVKTGSGLEIHEVDGGITSGPARMINVRLKPMEVQILAK
ncbi:alpha-amylase family glycosyl hydrolase [Candidatus Electronema sp. PJ]|uniref:alpha-amylase family glycosyl hydrolase n=1 Tax=Candidatus Electronema sp. PJ TaxID=3401572 RepID=UPI003AA84EF7